MNWIGCDPQQHVFEPGERFYPDTLAGSHEAPQDRRGLTALVAAKEGPIATTNRHTADGSFGGIIVDFQVPIFTVAGQRIPILQRVTYGTALRLLGRTSIWIASK